MVDHDERGAAIPAGSVFYRAQVEQIVAQAVAASEAALAECYRLTGADPDGNEDWRLAPEAVAEVARLRKECDLAEQNNVGSLNAAKREHELRKAAEAALADAKRLTIGRPDQIIEIDEDGKIAVVQESDGERSRIVSEADYLKLERAEAAEQAHAAHVAGLEALAQTWETTAFNRHRERDVDNVLYECAAAVRALLTQSRESSEKALRQAYASDAQALMTKDRL